MSDYVNTQDISSGRVHKRYPTEAGYATHEADNLDSAGAYRVLTETEFAFVDPDSGALCERCYRDELAAARAEAEDHEADDDGSTTMDTDAVPEG